MVVAEHVGAMKCPIEDAERYLNNLFSASVAVHDEHIGGRNS